MSKLRELRNRVSGACTYEECISGVLDALYDGAVLLTGSADRAEALALDVVVRGASAFRRGPRPSDFRAWILTRMVRQYLDFMRERHAPVEVLMSWSLEEGPAGEMEPGGRSAAGWEAASRLESADPERFGELVRQALVELPLEQRAATWLVGSVGVGYAEAAEAIGVGRSELRQLLFEGRRALHRSMERALLAEAETKVRVRMKGGC
ncbi:MAG: RNA polymerase sigma factor [Gemmatimonadota bacterium]